MDASSQETYHCYVRTVESREKSSKARRTQNRRSDIPDIRGFCKPRRQSPHLGSAYLSVAAVAARQLDCVDSRLPCSVIQVASNRGMRPLLGQAFLVNKFRASTKFAKIPSLNGLSARNGFKRRSGCPLQRPPIPIAM